MKLSLHRDETPGLPTAHQPLRTAACPAGLPDPASNSDPTSEWSLRLWLSITEADTSTFQSSGGSHSTCSQKGNRPGLRDRGQQLMTGL